MWVIEKHSAIYLAQPRTASHSIVDALKRQCGAEMVGGHHEWTDLALSRKYRIISGVRNHPDALRSFYHNRNYRKRKSPGPPGLLPWVQWFCEYGEWVRNHRLYWRYLPITTHVYRYEHLEDDLERICLRLGMPELKLPNFHASTPEDAPMPKAYVQWVKAYFADERRELAYP